MISGKKIFASLFIFTLIISMITTGCKKGDDWTPQEKTSYELKVKDVLGITGSVTFTKLSDTQTKIDIVMVGAPSGTHPAHIHFNSAVETGGIAISLNPVGANGISTTTVTKLDNNTTISYSELIDFDGYINVHESASNLGVLLAQADIGGNVLVSVSKSYNLETVNTSGVSGLALFEKRKNNTTLITISLIGTLTGASHPSHIHLGSVASVGGGPIMISLNDVNGTTGISATNVSMLDGGTAITYDDLLVYDGYINVHESSSNLASIICQGNIGSN